MKSTQIFNPNDSMSENCDGFDQNAKIVFDEFSIDFRWWGGKWFDGNVDDDDAVMIECVRCCYKLLSRYFM